MAMAARRERGLFDPETPVGSSPFDHHIYVIASDGDIEEGVTSEASSLAGVQELGNLIVFYDDNKISIEHDTTIALGEDVGKRYEAYGWHVQHVEGGENVSGILDAVAAAKAVVDRPSIILLRTIIGFPAPKKMNTGDVHGSALGADEVAAVKEALGFDPAKSFDVDADALAHAREVVSRGADARKAWQVEFDAWAARETERKELFDRLFAGEFPAAGPTLSRPTRPTPRALRLARPPVRRSTRSDRSCPSCGAAPPTSPVATTPPSRAQIRSARSPSPPTTGMRSRTAARSTSASASTRWARSSTASRCTDPPARTAEPSWSSPTTCVRRFAWPH